MKTARRMKFLRTQRRSVQSDFSKSIYRTQAAFEEICMQIVLPKLDDSFKLNVAVEYSAENETVNMVIKYTGEEFNPNDIENVLSLKLARNVTESIEHRQCSDGEYTNLVTVDIKEK